MPQAPEPFWLCHECHAETHPLMIDGVPHCASCGGDFLEIIDEDVNPSSLSDFGMQVFPEEIVNHLAGDYTHAHEHDHEHAHDHDHDHPIPHHHHDGGHAHAAPGGILSTMLSGLFGAPPPSSGPPQPTGQAPAPGTRPAETNGLRTMTFEFPGGGVGTFMIGRPGPLPPGQNGQAEGQTPGPPAGLLPQGLEDFFAGFGAGSGPAPRRRSENDGMAGGRRQQGPMDPNDLIEAMLGMLLDGRPPPARMGGAGGGPLGNLGDYVLSQEGFDNVMEHLMNAAGPQGPIPASQVVIDGLPRITMTEEQLEKSDYKDCPVCKDDYEPGAEVIRIPCSHIFHVDCLVPWLERNGSCPVCRFSLVPEGAQRPVNPNPNPTTNPNAAPAAQGTGVGNLVSNLFSAMFGVGRAREEPEEEMPGLEPLAEDLAAASAPSTGAGPASAAAPATTAATTAAPAAAPAPTLAETSASAAAPTAGVAPSPASASTNENDNAQAETPRVGTAEQPAAAPASGMSPYPSAIPQEYRDRHARRQAQDQQDELARSQAEEARLLEDLD